MIDRLAIVGVGLLGGSVAQAARPARGRQAGWGAGGGSNPSIASSAASNACNTSMPRAKTEAAGSGVSKRSARDANAASPVGERRSRFSSTRASGPTM